MLPFQTGLQNRVRASGTDFTSSLLSLVAILTYYVRCPRQTMLSFADSERSFVVSHVASLVVGSVSDVRLLEMSPSARIFDGAAFRTQHAYCVGRPWRNIKL